MDLLAATTDGLHVVDADRRHRRRVELAGHDVQALARDGSDGWWALTDGNTLRHDDGTGWTEVAAVPDGPATALLAGDGTVHVGTRGAHLLRLVDGHFAAVGGFEAVAGRTTWGTPWGGPPDVRSAARLGSRLFVNVHVGGIPRSDDGGETWEPTVDVDDDVHQVVADEDDGLVVAAAAVGALVSPDAGDTWSVETEGLHATYARAVALTVQDVLLTASTGPSTSRAALYGRPRAGGAFRRLGRGLPEWFDANVDTHWLAARRTTVAFATADGRVYTSYDSGTSWCEHEDRLPRPRALVLA